MRRSILVWRRFLRDCRGATSVEYALIALLVSIAILAGLTALSTEMAASWTRLADGLANASP